mgnify:CR=1 FL=1
MVEVHHEPEKALSDGPNAWPLGQDGRKLFAGTALATAQGAVLARARAVWIALGG